MRTQVNELFVTGRDEPVVIRNENGQLKKRLVLSLATDKSGGKPPIIPDFRVVELLGEALEEISRLKKVCNMLRSENRDFDDKYNKLNQLFYDTLMCCNCEDIAVSYGDDGSVKICQLSDVLGSTSGLKSFKVVLLNTPCDDFYGDNAV